MAHPTTNAHEPNKKWTRKVFPCTKPSGQEIRESAERETDRDLDKCLEQLLCDIHESHQEWKLDYRENPDKTKGDMTDEEFMTQKHDRSIELVLHAFVRMNSMMVQVVKSNNWMSKVSLGVAVVAAICGIAATACGIIALYK